MSGHLFVTRGSLTGLACDVILVPSGTSRDGRFGHVMEHWAQLPLTRDSYGCVTPAPDSDRRVVKLSSADEDRPSIWAGHTGKAGRSASWYADAVRAYIREARRDTARLRSYRPLADQRPLLALPLIGT